MQLKKFKDWKLENKILAIAAFISVLGLIIFLSLIPISQWLWAGWLFGVVAVWIGHGVSILLLKVLLKKHRSKANGFFNGLGRTITNYVIQVGFFFVLMAIDASYNGTAMFHGGTEPLVNGPIVIYTYLGGISVMMIATITSLFLKKKEGADETVRR